MYTVNAEFQEKVEELSQSEITVAGNFDGPVLGLELDENIVENERNVPEWEFPELWDSDGSVKDH